VPPESPDALARAIERFADDDLGPALRDGVARARARFSWEALVDSLVALAGECP
jgi:glycosyltransferase involved in cell wall biosynthesis